MKGDEGWDEVSKKLESSGFKAQPKVFTISKKKSLFH